MSWSVEFEKLGNGWQQWTKVALAGVEGVPRVVVGGWRPISMHGTSPAPTPLTQLHMPGAYKTCHYISPNTFPCYCSMKLLLSAKLGISFVFFANNMFHISSQNCWQKDDKTTQACCAAYLTCHHLYFLYVPALLLNKFTCFSKTKPYISLSLSQKNTLCKKKTYIVQKKHIFCKRTYPVQKNISFAKKTYLVQKNISCANNIPGAYKTCHHLCFLYVPALLLNKFPCFSKTKPYLMQKKTCAKKILCKKAYLVQKNISCAKKHI